MKAFIIHTPHTQSVQYAEKAMQSFKGFNGWEPKLFGGITVDTLPLYEKRYSIKTKKNSRAEDYFKANLEKYTIKKCCSLNHYRLFKECVELNEPIAVIEHDAHCISNWNDYTFEDVLVLNIASALQQRSLKPIWKNPQISPKDGIHDININGLNYRHDPTLSDAHIMPGTAAYAITPKGAKKMMNVYESKGWEQSDFIINTGHVRIQTIMPELFTFKLPNLAMSHGQNLK